MRPPATGRCAATQALAQCIDKVCPDMLSCWEGHALLSGRVVEAAFEHPERIARAASEQSYGWQGPTFVNWTEPIGYHPETYHEFGADLLRRMRQSSIFATVICDWQYALAQAEHSGRFVDVGAPPDRAHLMRLAVGSLRLRRLGTRGALWLLVSFSP